VLWSSCALGGFFSGLSAISFRVQCPRDIPGGKVLKTQQSTVLAVVLLLGCGAIGLSGALLAAPSTGPDAAPAGVLTPGLATSALPAFKVREGSGARSTGPRSGIWDTRQRITVAMSGGPSFDISPPVNRSKKPVPLRSQSGKVLRIPEVVVAVIFGMLGFLVVARRDLT